MVKKSDAVNIAQIQADASMVNSVLQIPTTLASNPNLHFVIAASLPILITLLIEHNKEWWGKGSEWWADKLDPFQSPIHPFDPKLPDNSANTYPIPGGIPVSQGGLDVLGVLAQLLTWPAGSLFTGAVSGAAGSARRV